MTFSSPLMIPFSIYPKLNRFLFVQQFTREESLWDCWTIESFMNEPGLVIHPSPTFLHRNRKNYILMILELKSDFNFVTDF